MTTIISRPGTLASSTARREWRSDTERRFARRRRLVHRGVVASYLHEISAPADGEPQCRLRRAAATKGPMVSLQQ